jgi:hypothetical protein
LNTIKSKTVSIVVSMVISIAILTGNKGIIQYSSLDYIQLKLYR